MSQATRCILCVRWKKNVFNRHICTFSTSTCKLQPHFMLFIIFTICNWFLRFRDAGAIEENSGTSVHAYIEQDGIIPKSKSKTSAAWPMKWSLLTQFCDNLHSSYNKSVEMTKAAKTKYLLFHNCSAKLKKKSRAWKKTLLVLLKLDHFIVQAANNNLTVK